MLEALPQRFIAAADLCARQTAAAARRGRALQALRHIDPALAPLQGRWLSVIPSDSIVRAPTFPLIHMIFVSPDYAEISTVVDLFDGIPIAGAIPAPGVLVPRVRGASVSLVDWRDAIPAGNKDVLARLRRSKDSELARDCWEKTPAVAQAGRAPKLRPIADRFTRSIPITPRFAIKEQRGGHALNCVISAFSWRPPSTIWRSCGIRTSPTGWARC